MMVDTEWFITAQAAVIEAATALLPIAAAAAEAPDGDRIVPRMAAAIRASHESIDSAHEARRIVDDGGDPSHVYSSLRDVLTSLEDALMFAGSVPAISLPPEIEAARVAALGTVAALLAPTREMGAARV